MKRCFPALLCVALCASPAAAGQNQNLAAGADATSLAPIEAPERPSGSNVAPSSSPTVVSTPSLFRPLASDFKRLFSLDSARTIAYFGGSAMTVATFDQQMVRNVERVGAKPAFGGGQLGGTFLLHAGAGVGTYVVGRYAGHSNIASFGAEVFRAQVLSQAVVQAGKLVTQRERPDGSNYHSLPSGHSATAFATAGVIERHFGWKAGIPAYSFAAYVAASRVSFNKHHLSDVVLGAGIGVVSSRAVTVKLGDRKFGVQVAPTQGGAAVSFSPQ